MAGSSDDWSWFDETPSSATPERSSGSTGSRTGDAVTQARSEWDEPVVRWAGDGGQGHAAGTAATGAVSAPVGWIGAAAVAAAIALIVSPLGNQRPLVSVIGWFLAGFVSLGLLAVFTYRDSAARTNPWYVIRPMLTTARVVVIAIAALAVVANAYFWADWFSRR